MTAQHLTMKEKDGDRKRITAFNKQVLSFLGVQYSGRPKVDTGYVEPTLFQSAHEILKVPNGNSICTSILYLGPKSAASQPAGEALRQANVVAIVNATTRVPCYHRPLIKYCQVPVNDEPAADIGIYLEGATTFLHAMLLQSSVLVHCEQGMSRSTTIVMAYLMRYHNMTRDQAYVHCKTKRPMVNPNEGFWRQLEDYETKLVSVFKTQASSMQLVSSKEKKWAFDAAWEIQSHALYTTCREIPKVMEQDDCWKRLERIQTPNEMSRILFVCLDFVWGRGIKNVDLDWLVEVCRYLPHCPSSPAQQVETMVRNPESEFVSTWSGEIYDKDVTRIVEALSK
jgi:hypothetical protein